jgi:hypothetical protein
VIVGLRLYFWWISLRRSQSGTRVALGYGEMYVVLFVRLDSMAALLLITIVFMSGEKGIW